MAKIDKIEKSCKKLVIPPTPPPPSLGLSDFQSPQLGHSGVEGHFLAPKRIKDFFLVKYKIGHSNVCSNYL